MAPSLQGNLTWIRDNCGLNKRKIFRKCLTYMLDYRQRTIRAIIVTFNGVLRIMLREMKQTVSTSTLGRRLTLTIPDLISIQKRTHTRTRTKKNHNTLHCRLFYCFSNHSSRFLNSCPNPHSISSLPASFNSHSPFYGYRAPYWIDYFVRVCGS